MIVVADASPLRYLALIGVEEVIPALYGNVLIPPAVLRELTQPGTPEKVRLWIGAQPGWLRLRIPLSAADFPSVLGPGESEAIALAKEVDAALLLIDDWAGRREATRRNLSVQGTLGTLSLAADHNLLDLPSAIARLQETNFRATPSLIRAALGQHFNPRS